MTITDITNAIVAGAYDADLTELESVITTRRRTLDKASRTYDNYPIGATVFFNNQTSPKYMRGMRAVVVSHESGRRQTPHLKVKLLSTSGRYTRDSIVNAPLAIVDRIS